LEGGRAGKGPAPLAPRRPAHPTRTVRDQFLVEITGAAPAAGTAVADLAELNRLFDAWVQASYHRAKHSETGEPPLARWARGIPEPLPLPSPAQLHEAFLWSERRTVKKTATVSLHGNLYQVDPSLVRCTVELIFDPFDLTGIDVRHKGKPAGKAVPFIIGRHRHAKTRDADGEQRAEPEPAGIDYLRILDTTHGQDLQTQINYAALMDGTGSPGADGAGPAEGQGNGRG
jgi:putative transposase